MAITNAQQAKQIMNEGRPMKKIKGQDHMLAYITPSEKDILVELGGQETMTPEGILAYPPLGQKGTSPGTTTSGASRFGGNDDRREQASVAQTKGKKTPTPQDVRNIVSKGPDDRSSDLQTARTYQQTGRYSPEYEDLLDEEDKKNYRTDVLTDDVALNKREKRGKDFLTTVPEYPGYIPPYLKAAANFNNTPNRRYFYEKVIRGGKIPGLDYDEKDLEEAYDRYMSNRLAGKTDAMGNPTQGFEYGDDGMLTGNFRDNGGEDNNYIPPVIPGDDTTEEEDTTPTRNLGGLAPRFAGSIFDFTGLANGGRAGMMDGGMMEDTPEGGIMDLESGRQMYFLGKLVKKATRAVKKVVKSPVGKMALGYALTGGLGNLAAGSGFGGMFKGFMSPTKFLARSKLGGIFSKLGTKNILGSVGNLSLGKKIGLGLGIPFALDALGVGKEEDDKMDLDEYYRKNSINIADIRNNPYNYLAPRFAADGGLMRTGYEEGGDAEPVAKKTMPLLDMDGMEKDYREDGGFVPIGRMERADDVPARLSKNEFVFTADAVRNAGEGDIDKGAEVMYNMMKNLESGGEVSEESQGLNGAREMFKTSQRLEEVL
jgi:hypothetical protein